jgi:hypothetical protein
VCICNPYVTFSEDTGDTMRRCCSISLRDIGCNSSPVLSSCMFKVLSPFASGTVRLTSHTFFSSILFPLSLELSFRFAKHIVCCTLCAVCACVCFVSSLCTTISREASIMIQQTNVSSRKANVNPEEAAKEHTKIR